jgi:DNA-binding transcriptional LysR family regulator
MRWNDRIGRRLKLSDLHILLTVAQCGSMSRAAKQLAVSHPVVSRSIGELEHTLGVRLLERHRNGAEPTNFGRALLERSQAVFDELRQSVRDIESLSDPGSGEVRVGSTVPLAASFVSGVIDQLGGRFPRIVCHVLTGETGALHRDLRERKVDILIARDFGVDEQELGFEFLFDNPYVIAAGAHHPMARKRKLKLAELLNERWVLPPPDSDVGSVIAAAFRASALQFPRVAVFSFAYEMRMKLLERGRYVTVLPSSVLRFPVNHPSVRALRVDFPIRSGPIGIITLKKRALNPAVRLFAEHARGLAKKT